MRANRFPDGLGAGQCGHVGIDPCEMALGLLAAFLPLRVDTLKAATTPKILPKMFPLPVPENAARLRRGKFSSLSVLEWP